MAPTNKLCKEAYAVLDGAISGAFLSELCYNQGYLTRAELHWLVYESTYSEYTEIKFMLACFILLMHDLPLEN